MWVASHLPAGGCCRWPGCTCHTAAACFRSWKRKEGCYHRAQNTAGLKDMQVSAVPRNHWGPNLTREGSGPRKSLATRLCLKGSWERFEATGQTQGQAVSNKHQVTASHKKDRKGLEPGPHSALIWKVTDSSFWASVVSQRVFFP
jgi:hypothetical protein